MKRCILSLCLCWGICAGAAELPAWFDTFQSAEKSLRGWQTFRAATALEFEEGREFIGGQVMKAKVRFSAKARSAILIWRFPDVQMNKFRLRVKLPDDAEGVFMRMVTNDTKGDAAFFKPWVGEGSTVELPIHTDEGQKKQPASPLPTGEWVTYEVTMPDDVFFEQLKKKPNHPVQEFALMNTGREHLKLSADSRPATEAFFITFTVEKNSPLFGRDLEFFIDLAEIY